MRELLEYYGDKAFRLVNNKYAKRLIFGLILCCLLAWTVQDTLIGTGSASSGGKEIDETVQLLKEMEQQTPPSIGAVKKDKKDKKDKGDKKEQKKEQKTDASPAVSDQKKEQDLIMSMENPDISVFNQRFEGCAVLGDSIAESAGEYGFLNSSILFAKIGCAVVGAEELVESMVQMYPKKIFISLGMNDLEWYDSDVDQFIQKYREMVDDIRESLPDSEIYVTTILPMQQKAIDKEPSRANAALYNEKLEELCQNMKMTFIDAGFILNRQPSLYEPDGIHPVKNFYYKWLTYLADTAGISE